MADLIDREVARTTICGNCYYYSTVLQECKLSDGGVWCKVFSLYDVPTIEAEPWIPCSERLPEESGTYLVWFEYYRYGDYDGMYATHGIGSFYHGRWAFINHETGWQSLCVIAWMPLPEPPESEVQKDAETD